MFKISKDRVDQSHRPWGMRLMMCVAITTLLTPILNSHAIEPLSSVDDLDMARSIVQPCCEWTHKHFQAEL